MHHPFPSAAPAKLEHSRGPSHLDHVTLPTSCSLCTRTITTSVCCLCVLLVSILVCVHLSSCDPAPHSVLPQIYQEEFGSVRGHFGPINTVAFSPDGRRWVRLWVLVLPCQARVCLRYPLTPLPVSCLGGDMA